MISLDSVPEGPGINDNGSGSSSLLEIVLQWYRSGLQPKNRIIFAWWGAEEIGLMGSFNFVQHMKLNSPDEFANIKLALNFDMLASPNYIPEIHNYSLPGAPPVRVIDHDICFLASSKDLHVSSFVCFRPLLRRSLAQIASPTCSRSSLASLPSLTVTLA